MASRTAATFSVIWAEVKERLPTPTPMFAVLSTLNSTRPALTALMPAAMSSVTVPDFGFGMRPFGPSTRARVRTCFMASVVAIATSKSSQPSLIFAIRSARPAWSAPAAMALSASSVKTMTRTFLPEPFGSGVVPRTIWSPCAGSTPRRKDSSMVSSNLAFGNLERISTASFSGYSLVRSAAFAALLYLLLCLTGILDSLRCKRPFEGTPAVSGYCSGNLVDDFDAHVTGGAGDHTDGGLVAVGVEVGLLDFDDLEDLLLRHLADLVAVRLGGTRGDAGGLLEEHGRRG